MHKPVEAYLKKAGADVNDDKKLDWNVSGDWTTDETEQEVSRDVLRQLCDAAVVTRLSSLHKTWAEDVTNVIMSGEPESQVAASGRSGDLKAMEGAIQELFGVLAIASALGELNGAYPQDGESRAAREHEFRVALIKQLMPNSISSDRAYDRWKKYSKAPSADSRFSELADEAVSVPLPTATPDRDDVENSPMALVDSMLQRLQSVRSAY